MTDDLTFPLARSAQLVAEDPARARTAFHEAAVASSEPCPGCGKRIRHRQGVAWCQDRQMSEKTLQNRVRDRARHAGWKVAHAGRGWVGGSAEEGGQWVTPMAPGWPDLTLAKAGHRLIFCELKRMDGVVSDEQVEWLQLLNATGNAAIIIRPVHLRDGTLKAVLRDGFPL